MMVRFGCIGDIHGHLRHLQTVVRDLQRRNVDALLLCGDFTPGRLASKSFWSNGLLRIIFLITRRLNVPVYYVPGNHDQPQLSFPGNIDRRIIDFKGVRIAGIGGAGPEHFGFPYEWEEEEIRQLQLNEWDVLISHTPPRNTGLDFVPKKDRHVGSQAIREIGEAGKGIIVCGHIHESSGIHRFSSALAYNCGSIGRPFARAQYGLLEVDPETKAMLITHRDIEKDTHWEAELPG